MTERIARLLAASATGLLLTSAAAALEAEATGQIATLPPVGEHWVWVSDRLLAHSVLFDGDDLLSGDDIKTDSSSSAGVRATGSCGAKRR